MKWYKLLTIHQKINAKDIMILACGVSFDSLGKLGFSFQDRIEIRGFIPPQVIAMPVRVVQKNRVPIIHSVSRIR